MYRALHTVLAVVLVCTTATAQQGTPLSGLPGYAIAETRAPDGTAQFVILRDSKQIQALPPCGNAQQAPEEAIRTGDFNFDSRPDLAVPAGKDLNDDEFYCVWLFDPATQQFVENEQLSRVPNPTPDAADKTVTATKHSGCGDCYQRDVYGWKGPSLELLRQEIRELDPVVSPTDDCRFVRTVKKRKGEQMKEVERLRVSSAGVRCEPHPVQ